MAGKFVGIVGFFMLLRSEHTTKKEWPWSWALDVAKHRNALDGPEALRTFAA
jgi:hypothetical protein